MDDMDFNEQSARKSSQNASGHEAFVKKYFDTGKSTEHYAQPESYLGGKGNGQGASKGNSTISNPGGGSQTGGGIDP